MKKYFAFALALIMMLSVAACGGDEGEGEESSPYVVMTPFGPSPQFDTPIVVDPDDPFTGTWEDEEEGIMSVFYTFTGDGRGVVDITDIRYYFVIIHIVLYTHYRSSSTINSVILSKSISNLPSYNSSPTFSVKGYIWGV